MSETVKKNWLTDENGVKIAPKTVIDQVIDLDGTPLSTILDGKAGTLSTQTAYSAKGSATKVPQITTNTLGQVTGITEVTITQPDISGKENSSNKVTSWSSTTTDTHYPSEKLVKTALDGKMASTVTHLSGDIATSEKGANNGVATLGSDGKVPSSQLPSYVDDVLEYSAKASFPTTGETGKIYVDTTTNKTYRWSGSAYVEISPSIALGETSSTAYAGDKGKANATAIAALQTTVGALPTSYAPTNSERNVIVGIQKNGTDLTPDSNRKVNVTVPTQASDIGAMASTVTHLSGDVPTTRKVNNKALSADITLTASDVGARASDWTPSKSDIGLGNVGNFKAVSTVASQGLTDTEKSNARANIGAGTSSFSGNYNDLSNKPTIPSAVTESTVSGWGFTKNTGTYSKPSTGIPASDLASGVIPTSLPANGGTATNVSGTVAIANGGTGATTAANARTNLGLGGAATKAVDTSISAASTSANIPTSAAVASFVEGKGYKTTDNNTTYSFTEGTTNGAFSVTPSGGSATSVKIHGLGSLAYSSATIPTVTDTYSSTSSNGMSGKAVASAISSLQPKLVAGSNITIDPATNTISASGGGSSSDILATEYAEYYNMTSDSCTVYIEASGSGKGGSFAYTKDHSFSGGMCGFKNLEDYITVYNMQVGDSFACDSRKFFYHPKDNSEIYFIDAMGNRYVFSLYRETNDVVYIITKPSSNYYKIDIEFRNNMAGNGMSISGFVRNIIIKIEPQISTIKNILDKDLTKTKYLGGTLNAGDTRLTFTDVIFVSDVAIDIYAEDETIGWLHRQINKTTSTLTLIFAPQTKDINIRVRVERIGS